MGRETAGALFSLSSYNMSTGSCCVCGIHTLDRLTVLTTTLIHEAMLLVGAAMVGMLDVIFVHVRERSECALTAFQGSMAAVQQASLQQYQELETSGKRPHA